MCIAHSALQDKPGQGNGLYLVTDPRKCLINSIQHSTENPCVRGSIPRGATPDNLRDTPSRSAKSMKARVSGN